MNIAMYTALLLLLSTQPAPTGGLARWFVCGVVLGFVIIIAHWMWDNRK